MLTETERKELTVESAKASVAGLHFVHVEVDDKENDGKTKQISCLDCYDAAKLVSWINDRPVDIHYLSSPIQRGNLHPVRFSTRNMYPFDELKLLVVRMTRGRPSESKLSDDAKKAISKGQEKRWAKAKEKASAG